MNIGKLIQLFLGSVGYVDRDPKDAELLVQPRAIRLYGEAEVLAHMSNKWTFKHGQESLNMSCPGQGWGVGHGSVRMAGLQPLLVCCEVPSGR